MAKLGLVVWTLYLSASDNSFLCFLFYKGHLLFQLLVWAICDGVNAEYKEKDSFVQPLDYSSLFQG